MWLSWHTVFSLRGGVAPLLALARTSATRSAARRARDDRCRHRGFRDHDRVRLRVLHHRAESRYAGSRRFGTHVAAPPIIQIQRFALLAAMVAASGSGRSAEPGGARTGVSRSATAIGFLIRGVSSLAIVRGTYEPGSVYDLTWIAPFVFTLWAIAEAPASAAEEAAPASRPSDPWLADDRPRDGPRCRLRRQLSLSPRIPDGRLPRAPDDGDDDRRARAAHGADDRTGSRASPGGRPFAAAGVGGSADGRSGSRLRSNVACAGSQRRRSRRAWLHARGTRAADLSDAHRRRQP